MATLAGAIKLRRGTAAAWTSANPTLAAGEAGYETDTGKLKVGDGTTAWTSLAYFTVVLDADDIDDTSTTNKFATAAELTKLSGIEANADVTDAANVAAAGAFMASNAGDLATQDTVTSKLEKVYTVPGALTVAQGSARMYFKRNATITNVYASVGTAPTGQAILVDVHKNGTTIFTTQGNRVSIAASGNSDMTATPDVTSVTAGEYLTVDVDQIGSGTAGSDLVVVIEYTEAIS